MSLAETLQSLKDSGTDHKVASLHNFTLTPEDAQTIYSSLKSLKIKGLSLSKSTFNLESALLIASLILENSNINSLDLSGCQLGDEVLNIFHTAVKYAPITSYNVSETQMSDESFCFLLSLLRNNNNNALVHLDLHNNKIKASGAMDIDAGQEKKDDVVSLLASMLKENRTLEKVNLSGLGLGDEGVSQIFSMIQENYKIRELNLEENEIGRKGYLAVKTCLSDSVWYGSLPSSSLSFPPPRCLLESLSIQKGNFLSKSELLDLELLVSSTRGLSEQRIKQRSKIETILVDSLETTQKIAQDLQALKENHLKLTLHYLLLNSEHDKRSKKGVKKEDELNFDQLFENPKVAVKLLHQLEEQTITFQTRGFNLAVEVEKLGQENNEHFTKVRALKEVH